MKKFFTFSLLVFLTSSHILGNTIKVPCEKGTNRWGVCYGSTVAKTLFGDIAWEYEGELKNTYPNGRGCKTWSEGSTWCGEWKNGNYVKGIYRHNDGSTYEGEYDGLMRSGKGIYTRPDGSFFKGIFKDNDASKGFWQYYNGDTYSGDVGNYPDTSLYLAKHGQGTLVSTELDLIYKGEWKNDQRHGSGSEQRYSDKKLIRDGVWQFGKYIGSKKEFKAYEIESQKTKSLYNKIYNSCILDNAKDVDMNIKSIQQAVEDKCNRIADDPSWLENLMYNTFN